MRYPCVSAPFRLHRLNEDGSSLGWLRTSMFRARGPSPPCTRRGARSSSSSRISVGPASCSEPCHARSERLVGLGRAGPFVRSGAAADRVASRPIGAVCNHGYDDPNAVRVGTRQAPSGTEARPVRTRVRGALAPSGLHETRNVPGPRVRWQLGSRVASFSLIGERSHRLEAPGRPGRCPSRTGSSRFRLTYWYRPAVYHAVTGSRIPDSCF